MSASAAPIDIGPVTRVRTMDPDNVFSEVGLVVMGAEGGDIVIY